MKKVMLFLIFFIFISCNDNSDKKGSEDKACQSSHICKGMVLYRCILGEDGKPYKSFSTTCKLGCDEKNNRCIDCVSDRYCKEIHGDNSSCDPSTNRCIVNGQESCLVQEFDPSTNTCVQCIKSSDCINIKYLKASCEDNYCIYSECSEDSECEAKYGEKSKCNKKTNICKVYCEDTVSCSIDDRPYMQPACDSKNNICVQCIENEDCTELGQQTNMYCDNKKKLCVECTTDEQCTQKLNAPSVCKNNSCYTKCNNNNCKAFHCNSENNLCDAWCLKDEDCTVYNWGGTPDQDLILKCENKQCIPKKCNKNEDCNVLEDNKYGYCSSGNICEKVECLENEHCPSQNCINYKCR